MRLCDYLTATCKTQKEFAAEIGTRQSTISRYLLGRFPGPDMVEAIKAATRGQVTESDWQEEWRERQAAKVRRGGKRRPRRPRPLEDRSAA